MNIFLFLVWAGSPHAVAEPTVIKQTLAPIPDESEYFFQKPTDVATSAAGEVYILDNKAQMVFKFDASGVFVTTIGRPGAGPGEFQFANFRPGLISVNGGKVFVFSGVGGKLDIFDTQGTYLETHNIGMGMHLIKSLYALKGNQLLTASLSYNMHDDLKRTLTLSDLSLEPTATLMAVDEAIWRHEDNKMIFHAFSPQMTVGVDVASGMITAGFPGESKFKVFQGERELKTIEVDLPRRLVTQAQKDGYLKDPRFQSPQMVAEFPERHPYYTHVFPIEDGFLSYMHVASTGEIWGIVMNRNGKVMRTFTEHVGEEGRIDVDRSRIFKISLNADDEFEISEIEL